jgi:hypothetical protein
VSRLSLPWVKSSKENTPGPPPADWACRTRSSSAAVWFAAGVEQNSKEKIQGFPQAEQDFSDSSLN